MKLSEIARLGGLTPFELHRETSLTRAAARALEGRSHYFDRSTARAFGSHVRSCAIYEGGILLGVVESLASGFDRKPPRQYAPAFFNLLGERINSTFPCVTFSSHREAREEYIEQLGRMDFRAILLDTLREHRRRHDAASLAANRALTALYALTEVNNEHVTAR